MKRLGLPQYSAVDWLNRINASPYANSSLDSYSEGKLVLELENQIATLLNKPAALFFSKGMTAQFCMLKVAERRAQKQRVIMSPYSHLAVDEENSFEHLLGLEAIFPTHEPRPYVANDLNDSVTAAAMLVELPLRRAGFKLPSWDDLLVLREWASERSIHFHMDGARLWESRHFYNRSEADIASLFDTAYVSLYKGLGGLGGALLTGEKDFIEECKVWRSRFAGNHYTLFPFLITALDGLAENYAKMEELVERAKEIAKALSGLASLHIAEIHTNGFFVFLDKSLITPTHELNSKIETLSKQLGIHVTNGVTTMPYSEQRILEIQVGANHQDISTDEIISYFERLLATSTR